MAHRATFIQGKIKYSIGIVLVYLIGRHIPIPWIAQAQDPAPADLAAAIAGSMLGASENSSSIFSLGFGPWMTAMIVVTVIRSLIPRERREQAGVYQQRWIMALTLVIAVIQASVRAARLSLNRTGLWDPEIIRIITALLLIAGSFLSIWLVDRNQRHGLGGTSLLVLVNILDSMRTTVLPYLTGIVDGSAARAGRHYQYVAALVYCVVLVLLIILFQNAEIRIPVDRVSIHNVYADKDYIAISLNPAGTMPVMFAMTFFLLPSYFLRFLAVLMPARAGKITGLAAAFTLNTTAGDVLYLMIMAVLTFVFAHVNVDAADIAEGFQKSGDCIPDVRAGEETRRYIEHQLLAAAGFSTVMMCIGIGVPMALGNRMGMQQELIQLIATIMVLTGILLQIFEEYTTLKTFEYYEPFL